MNQPIVVIGGGPAGSTCALQLARLGHKVVLVDRNAGLKSKPGETCGPRVRQLLQNACDLSIPTNVFRSFDSFCSAWGSEDLDARSFTFWEADQGLVLDRADFDNWLLDAAQMSGVTVLRGFEITEARSTSAGWTINAAQQRLAACFIVEAVGSRVRSVVQPGVKRLFTDKLVCLSIDLPAQSSSTEGVMVESCEAGWWYTAQLPNYGRIVSFFTDSDMLPRAENRVEWLNSLLNKTSHIRRVIGEIASDSTVRICDARTSIRNVLWREGWLPIGDAAWCLDPLSGLGIQRAIKDGIDAAQVISAALTSGSAEQLRDYAVAKVASFRQSLVTQNEYYSVETRWRDALFWRRRI